MRVDYGWLWEGKTVKQLEESRHKHPCLLAAAVECPSPNRFNLLEETLNGSVISGQTVIGIVAAQDCAEPTPLIGDRDVHPLPHFQSEFLQLADHPLALRLPFDNEEPVPALTAIGRR